MCCHPHAVLFKSCALCAPWYDACIANQQLDSPVQETRLPSLPPLSLPPFLALAAFVAYFINHPLYTAPPVKRAAAALATAMLCQFANFRCAAGLGGEAAHAGGFHA